MHHRAFSFLAATLAALALAATPALAGENDGDSSSQVQNLPAPAGAPQGGVATGLGGTARAAPDGLPIGLVTGGLLLTGAGAPAAIRRRMA
jgi:hypothetical protein